ncbi:MAG: Na/Pi cotransporter family protein [Sphaerochaetaceae bacterium]|nr:Na/Pi cotransporter family protein [Sphaerochaetaceae bacterium]
MNISAVIQLLGGVALFLFGMTLMGDGLKRIAGNKLEIVLYKLSGTPLKGILLGTGVTAVIQSSSATSVMVVGFVNSGMMNLTQAIGIIMGAIIGTSVTGWIISLSDLSSGGGNGLLSLLSTETLSAVIAIVGIYFRMFKKRRKDHYLGDIMLGFSVLMFGMKSMSGSVSGLRSSPAFINALTSFSNPILGVLIGLLFTTIIQSASAAIGILQALTSTGAINFEIAFPIIMGIGIGASVPVLLSALGASTAGKQTALSYLVIDTLGAIIISILFYVPNAIFHFSFATMTMTSVKIALVNTVYRVIVAVVLLPFIGLLEKLVIKLVKDNGEADKDLEDVNRLEERFVKYPALAVEQTRLAINAMGEKTAQNLLDATGLIKNGFTEQGLEEVARLESVIDKYEDKIGTYLMKLTGRDMTKTQSRNVSKYLHTLTDFERISDHALNIAENTREMKEKDFILTEEGQNDISVLVRAIERIVTLTVKSFVDDDLEMAHQVEPLEELIDDLIEEVKLRHIARLQRGECNISKGYVFNDLLTNFERVSDHCSNIAEAMLELESEGAGNVHEYTNQIKREHLFKFETYFNEFKAEYHL